MLGCPPPARHEPLLRRPTPGDERGDVLMSWLVKISVVLGVVGIALFDAISVGSTVATVTDQGNYAARQASEVWLQDKNLQAAYDAAVAAADQENPANKVATKDFRVDEDGTVHLTVSRTAKTIVIRRIGPIEKWAHVSRTAEGRSVG
jgi:hypothetical protein